MGQKSKVEVLTREELAASHVLSYRSRKSFEFKH